MSIDLEWSKLDSSLANSLVEVLNRQLQNSPRPSFIGPVEVTSFDFGSQAPDIELVDLRNIHPDFLEDDDEYIEGDRDPVKVTEGADDNDGFEWVSRKAVGRAMTEEAPAYHHLPPHVRYGRGPSSEMFTSATSFDPSRGFWNGARSVPTLSQRNPYLASPFHISPSVTPPFAVAFQSRYASARPSPMVSPPSPLSGTSSPPADSLSSQPESAADPQPAQTAPHPNLQLHLHITWNSNLRLNLSTSLHINYPSPLFMSLPIRLSVTGLLFTGELAVAYEGAGPSRRVHLCILDELDPYGPAGERPKRDSMSSSPGGTPDEDVNGTGASPQQRGSKPLPIGQRLLPNIFIESELGQADKHVLKNVTRVERFIQDVIRKTVEEELVFPNFHTLVLG